MQQEGDPLLAVPGIEVNQYNKREILFWLFQV